MRKHVVIEELHVTILVPADITPKAASAIRRAVRGQQFEKVIKDAVGSFCQQNSALATARVKVSR